MSSNHAHNTVVNAKSVTGTFIKGIDEIHKWLIATASRHEKLDEGIVHAMIRDWKDAANYVFPFAPESSQEGEFKNSKRGMFLKNTPKFSAAPD